MAHGYTHPVPFRYDNKRAFAGKYLAFIVIPFCVPFIAAGYQLYKSGASSTA
ncbi:uncharacterized protein LAESUDRAFT_729607 [Laetiporus sulphureus 93-53]|uniref:Cytochrome c oxidase subunit 8, mitochondrial n=1 Tax=Laetiporus sulphureus 93-53 TaxID=1314785 RepID=A0A165CMS8_9APHY|nr:uncharacterized protein LAESUDRAFT_729607 [Laetiporus sulphureus 93-53]KZT03096.1 hypothetical protein LAESUDRAFT_729607 [Laetiporus sulphureus 93-53]